MSNDAKIRILIIDDSATIRSALKIMIRRETDMEVIGTAADGAEGLRMAVEESPDVILMDIEMPVMDGIEATRRIMEVNPVPILIFSSLAEEAAPKTLEALESGAVDFVLKDTTSQSALDIGGIKRVLIEKIRAFCRKRDGDSRPSVARTIVRNRRRLEARTGRLPEAPETPVAGIHPASFDRGASPLRGSDVTVGFNRKHAIKTTRITNSAVPRAPVRLIGIGASTGGPQALTTLMQSLPRNLGVPIVIVQHMPASFVSAFAKRLEAAGHLPVQVAEHGKPITPDAITLAPGGQHLRVAYVGGGFKADVSSGDVPGVLHRPSVDVFFDSMVDTVGGSALAMVLTGMGRDGAAGAKRLHGFGATVLAQDESSSVVYGMPRAVAEEGSADIVLPIEELGDALVKIVRRAPAR